MISAGNHLLYQLRFAQAIQASGGKDDGVVVSGFELAQASVHVAAQRMNVEVGADRF